MTTISRWVFKAPHVLKATLFSAQREMNYIFFFFLLGWWDGGVEMGCLSELIPTCGQIAY